MPEETLALNRCLASLSGALNPPKPESPLPASHRDPPCNNSYEGGNLAGASSSGRKLKPDTLPREPTARSDDLPGGSDIGGSTGARAPSGRRRGISAILVGVREELTRTRTDPRAVSNDKVSCLGIDRRRDDDQSHFIGGKRPRVSTEDNGDLRDSSQGPPPSKVAKSPPLSVPPNRDDSSTRPTAAVDENHNAEQTGRVSAHSETGGAAGGTATGNGMSERGDGSIGPDGKERPQPAVRDPPENVQDGEELESNKEEDSLPAELREKMTAVAEKLTAARARGSTSMDVKGAAASAVSLLQDTVSSGMHPSARRAFAQQQNQRAKQQQHPFEIVCKGLGLDKPLGKRRGEDDDGAESGCGDDVIMEVCSGFVTSALSLRNCLAFFSAVLVPRARALAGPATRLFVTAVSGIAKARPGAAIDGLVLPLLRDTDPAELGSAQCELCTRLIKQVSRWISLLLCKAAPTWWRAC